MPPRKPTKPATRSSGRQNTLSFGTSKVTKPRTSESALGKAAESKAAKLLEESEVSVTDVSQDQSPAVEVVKIETGAQEKPTTAELALREQTKQEAEVLTEEEERAAKISEAQIKKYWKGKEDSRIAPRVHQQGLTLQDKVLREFDLSSHFGPCIGIPRTKRWKRAQKLGLGPPIEVLAVLMKQDAKSKPAVQRAYIDELMNSRTLVE